MLVLMAHDDDGSPANTTQSTPIVTATMTWACQRHKAVNPPKNPSIRPT